MFEIRVESIFSVAGRGSVLVGTVERGPIRVGDAIVVETPSRSFRDTVGGLERDRAMHAVAAAGETVAVLCRRLGPDDLADCWVGEGAARRPVGVMLRPAPRRWWEVWRDAPA